MGKKMQFAGATKIYNQLKKEILLSDVALDHRVNKNAYEMEIVSYLH